MHSGGHTNKIFQTNIFKEKSVNRYAKPISNLIFKIRI